METHKKRHELGKFAPWVLILMASAAAIVLLGIWLFTSQGKLIQPGSQQRPERALKKGTWVEAHYVALRRFLPAVGTISPISPVNLAARISGRVVYVHLYSGEKVHVGEVLIRLNETRLRAQVAASVATASMAKAELKQALIDQRRDRILLGTGDVTQAVMDVANTAVATDQASLANAIAREKTARTFLGYARIVSPMDGIVRQKLINVGDTVMPGELLAKIYDPSRLQLNATVRQSLADHLRLREVLPIRLAGITLPIMGAVRQIVPHVSTRTRSFTIKIVAKFPPGVWPGMFGRADVPLGIHRILVIPDSAIEHIGQLDIVHEMSASGACIATIQLGRKDGIWREVLSGLAAGQKVWTPGGKPDTSREFTPFTVIHRRSSQISRDG